MNITWSDIDLYTDDGDTLIYLISKVDIVQL